MAKIKVQYFKPDKFGLSGLDHEEEWEDTEESFIRFYHLNNRLKYCNGTYYKFADIEVRKRYENEFFPRYNTISNYYGNGTVD
jgi:hypothetical protein